MSDFNTIDLLNILTRNIKKKLTRYDPYPIKTIKVSSTLFRAILDDLKTSPKAKIISDSAGNPYFIEIDMGIGMTITIQESK